MKLVRDQRGCDGCALREDGNKPFVPDEAVDGSETFILGQNPGEAECEQGRPFCGPTGEQMERIYFPRARLIRGSHCSIGNAVRCRWKGSNTLPATESVTWREAAAHCTRSHFKPPSSTRLFVAQGAYALSALTSHSKITDWRGWVLPATYGAPGGGTLQPSAVYTPRAAGGLGPLPVLATGHLASLYKTGRGSATDKGAYLTNLTAFRADWSRIPQILAGIWPQPLPVISREPPLEWPRVAAFDTEFNRYTKALHRYSLAWRDEHDQPHVHVVEAGLALGTPAPAAPPTVILHNAPADLRTLRKLIGTHFRLEDTMLAHAVLWPDLPHDLSFVSSLYSRTNRWKHLSETNPVEYAGGDALGTYDLWQALSKEFQADPRSEAVYREETLPLLPLIERCVARGLKVHSERVEHARTDLQEQSDAARLEAEAAVGWPINLGSPSQVAKTLYDILKVK